MFLRKFSTFHGWHKILLWFLTIGWMSVIFGFSSQNSGQSSGISRTLAELLSDIVMRKPFYDLSIEEQNTLEFIVRKFAHFSEYAILGVLLASLVMVYYKSIYWYGVVAIFCFFYAVTDEWHQSFVPGRVPAWKDICIDSAGAVTGIVFFLICKYFYYKYKSRKS